MVPKRSTVADHYDSIMYDPLNREYYDQSDFYNYGYWGRNTRSQAEASANLMEQLVKLMPEKRGIVLDVACGKGATTQYLLRHYQPSNVVAINISEKQLQTARINAPIRQYYCMDAVNMAFKNEIFENVICVEAVFHFDTREMFIHESYRILKRGGSLILSDIIHSRILRRYPGLHVPAANLVTDLDTYASAYRKAGFQDIKIIDTTNQCWRGFRRNLLRYGFRKGIPKAHLWKRLLVLLVFLLLWSLVTKRYLLVSARKG
jgi:cyclopropane fatty-acyl-phospholipid synthase-like methyltransferase